MVLLMIILSDDQYLEEILAAFLEIGITGATVLQAHGMGGILSQDVPIFAGLRSLFPGGEEQHRLMISVTTGEKASEAVKLLENICGPFEKPGAGIAFTVPVEAAWGLAREL